jgi:single-stranded-DNA-specific exonuclease
VLPYVPDRLKEGYGLNLGAVEQFAQQGVGLMVVVDCGSGNRRELETALSLGLSAIVVDHHRVHGPLPEPVAFVSPRRPENRYDEVELAAVGVAFALLRALLGEDAAEMYLPYVALGTVADVVPLREENRVLAARGIMALRRWGLPGIGALCDAAGIDKRRLGAYEIGYMLGPRLNAAGRMATPTIALDWFLADDPATATPLAQRLTELNQQRQAVTQRIFEQAQQQLESAGGAEQFPALVVDGEGWSIGVAGIVASKLAEAHYRPAVVIERGPEVSRGSARSGGLLDIHAALSQTKQLFTHFGGHAAAAGFTLPTMCIEQLRSELMANVFDSFGGRLPQRELSLDAEIEHSDLTLDTVDLLAKLEPHGRDNPPPRLLVRNVRVESPRLSRDGKHLLFQSVDQRGRRHDTVYFSGGPRIRQLANAGRVDLAASLRRDAWNGRTRFKLQVDDFRATEQR